MKITAPTISRAQREMNLPTRPPTPEKKIIELFHKGWSGQRIHKHLRVAANQIFATFHKYGLRRNARTPEVNLARFIAAVKKRENYVIRLAQKYDIGICKAYEIAKTVTQTQRFRPGVSKPVLSSDFPQRHFDRKLRAGN